MKKIILALALLIPLTGCAGLSQRIIGIDVTASISNPVTPAMLYEVENGARLAAAGLLTYRRLCIAKKIDQSCRGTIARIQVYTRALVPILGSLRAFVKNNDQVNAITAFNTARDLLTSINAAKVAANISSANGG